MFSYCIWFPLINQQKNSDNVDLDLGEKQLVLIENHFKYKLEISLPFRVDPDSSTAKFDVKKQILTVCAKVVITEKINSGSCALDEKNEQVEIVPAVERPIPTPKLNPDILAHNMNVLESVQKKLNDTEQTLPRPEKTANSKKDILVRSDTQSHITKPEEEKIEAQMNQIPCARKNSIGSRPQTPEQDSSGLTKPTNETPPPLVFHSSNNIKQKEKKFPVEFFTIELSNKYIFEID